MAPLTPEVAKLVASGILMLAFDEPGTISSAEHGLGHALEAGAAGISEHLEHGKLIQMHVKTPQGEEFYHLPIGSLIVKHPGPVHGEHSRMLKAGEHTFAIPKNAKTFVPKDTDMTDEKAVNDASKHVILKSSAGEERHAHISAHTGNIQDAGKLEPFENQETHQNLHDDWKELPHGKKPVSFGGKISAWVPHEWQIYKGSESDEKLAAKWGKDAEGKWHLIHKAGAVEGPVAPNVQEAAKHFEASGKIKPDVKVPEPGPAHVEPIEAKAAPKPSFPALKPGEKVHLLPGEPVPPPPHALAKPAQASIAQAQAASAKINIGGVPVTKAQIHDAINILNKDKSTAVKQPLAHAGHPLAAMDYHGVSKAVLKAHPELKVAKGSKQAHVGQVKLTILHHLAEQAGQFPATQAEEHVAETVKEKVQEQAKHAETLTPATHELGGVSVTKEEIAAAIKHLGATKSTQINQTLKAKGNPLGKSDYWAIVHAHQKAFPESTKGLKAKPVFMMALQHHLDQLGKEDEETGHNQAVAVHNLVDKGVPIEKQNGFLQSLQSALKLSHQHQQVLWINKTPNSSYWGISHVKPGEGPFYRVAPDHSVKFFNDAADEGTAWDHHAVASTVKALFGEPKPVVQSQTKKLTEELAPEKIEAPAVLPKPPEEPVKDIKKEPGWEDLHASIEGSEPVPYDEPQAKSEPVIAAAIKMAAWGHDPWYAVKQDDGKWHMSMTKPAAGSYGAPSKDYIEALPDHQVTTVTKNGVHYPWDVPNTHDFVKQHFTPNAKPEMEPPEGHKEPEAEAAKTLPLVIHGSKAADIPLGSQVYHTVGQNDDQAPYKYVKTPDGEWHQYSSEGKIKGGFDKDQYDKHITDGILKPEGPAAQATTDTTPSATIAEQPALAEPKPPEFPKETIPEGQMVVHISGKQVATVPAGSAIFYDKLDYDGNPQTPATAKVKYVHTPDDDWKAFYAGGPQTVSSYDKKYELPQKLAKGQMQEEGTETAEQLAAAEKAANLAKELKTGTIEGLTGYQQSVAPDFEKGLAAAAWKASKNYDKSAHFYQKDGKWQIHGYSGVPYDAKDDYYTVKMQGVPTLTHTVGNVKQELDGQQVYDALGKHFIPDSVLINGKAHKSGYYYNPKSTKTFLEIKADVHGGYFKGYANKQASSKAIYTWHKSDGTTEKISPVAATKKLETNTEYHPEPKQGIEAGISKGKALKYGTLAQPGVYKTWSTDEQAPSTLSSIEIKPDGSAVMTHQMLGEVPLQEDELDNWLKGGALLDKYGTTVVKPGIEPDTWHIFGSQDMTGGQMEQFLSDLQETHSSDDTQAFKNAVTQHLPGWQMDPLKSNLKAFFGDKNAIGNGVGPQRGALEGLLHEMLQVPEGKAGDFQGKAAEPVYLKGLPPGINKPEDVFTWAGNGMAKPVGPHITQYSGGEYVSPLSSQTSPELADTIKAISQAHGSGKVVGTHVASLSKDQRIAWLQAWRKGDMAKVFDLDASGGKVSPLHPGAPANVNTHSISWSPWNPSEVPASKAIPGTWTDHNKITLPKAEIANYVIKAGLEHPEHLSQAELRQWVKSHRSGNQDVVDHLSSMAHDRWQGGQSKLTDTPVWSDNLQPAKSYDIHVEEKKAASSWPEQAVTDYVHDNWDKLKPFAELDTGNPQVSQYSSYYNGHPLIQKYLDSEEAKWVAEQSKPVYSTTPGAASLVSSHPIYEITATVPLTGEKTQWLFKPAPYVGAGQSPKYIPDKAHAAATLARLWGYRTPESRLITHDGKYGNAQRKLANLGDLVGGKQLGKAEAPKIDFGSYTDRQLQDVAKEHVLDWALDNPDGRAANMLHMPDGSIVGIDKEHAWRNFGKWNGVTGDEKADTFSKLVATQLYNAVRNHQVSKESADAAYKAVIYQARRMQQLPDARMAKILEDGLKERTDFQDYGKGVKGRSNYIDAIINRKQGLEQDFQKLWAGVYKDAGWKLPEVPQNKLSHGLHSGFSEPTFFDHVVASKSHGVPAFFASHDLDRSSFLVWHETAGDQHYIRGETRITGNALKAVSKWASDHQEGTLVNPLPVKPAAPKIVQPVVKPEEGWHTKIVDAAKAVSKHAGDQVYTGSWTSAKLADMEGVKQSATSALTSAQHAIQQGPDSALWQSLEKTYGHPEHVSSAAQHYLNQIKQVEDAKLTAGQFHKGDLPRWEGKAIKIKPAEAAAEPKPEVTGVKVELRPATRILNNQQTSTSSGAFASDHLLGKEDGALHLGDQVYSYPGNTWHITLPTGEIIEINDEEKTSSVAAHVGRIRFRAVAANGSASLENIRSHLQAMGLPLDEATQHDMEVHYWRHIGQQLSDRKDHSTGNHALVWNALKAAMTEHGLKWDSTGRPAKNIDTLAHANIDPATEVGMYHQAFSHLTSAAQVQQWTEHQGYLPHLNHPDVHQPELTGGKPIWYRFDMDPKSVADRNMPTHHLYDGTTDALHISRTGNMYSTEARLRALGIWKSGSSSTGDMKDHGSSGVLYLRYNSPTDYSKHIWLNPRVLARTDTYGFDHDAWGDINKRTTMSYWNPDQALSSSNHETDINDAASLLDDIELLRANNEEQRQQIISELKSHGITQIRGLPVEDRIISQMTPQALAKVRAAFTADPSKLMAHPAEAYVPPQAEAISAEKSATETAEEISKAEEGGTKGIATDEVLPTHELAAPAEKVNQLFYHSPEKTAGAKLNSEESIQVKSDTAKRLADNMTSSTEDIVALAKDAGLPPPPPSWGPQRQATLGTMVQVWAKTNTSPIARAYQQVAHNVFGIGKEPSIKLKPDEQAEVDKLIAQHGPVIEDFLKTQYALTQKDLKDAGITHVTLHRGFAWGKGSGPWGTPLFGSEKPEWASAPVGSHIDTPATKPLSSFAAEPITNNSAYGEFMSHGGSHTAVKTTVPASLVFSYPRSGMGSYWQSEFIVLDSPGQWEIVKQG